MAKQWFRVFKAGTYPQGTFDHAYLDTVVRTYNPKDDHHAPLVLGEHPKKGPAFGWVDGVRREGDYLEVSFSDVPDAMKGNAAFRKPSVKFYDDRPYLYHVALLGAAPPQVNGLDVQFSEEDQNVKTVDFNEPVVAEAEVEVPLAPVAKPKPAPTVTPVPPTTPKMEQEQEPEGGEVDPKIAALIAKAVADATSGLKEQLAGVKKEMSEVESRHRKQRLSEFSERAARDGILTKADLQRPGFAEFADALLDVDVEFTEGEGEVKVNAREWFEDFVSNLRPQVPMKPAVIHRGFRHGSGTKIRSEIAGGKEFQVHTPTDASEDDVKMLERTRDIAAERGITFEDAARLLDQEEGISRHKD